MFIHNPEVGRIDPDQSLQSIRLPESKTALQISGLSLPAGGLPVSRNAARSWVDISGLPCMRGLHVRRMRRKYDGGPCHQSSGWTYPLRKSARPVQARQRDLCRVCPVFHRLAQIVDCCTISVLPRGHNARFLCKDVFRSVNFRSIPANCSP